MHSKTITHHTHTHTRYPDAVAQSAAPSNAPPAKSIPYMHARQQSCDSHAHILKQQQLGHSRRWSIDGRRSWGHFLNRSRIGSTLIVMNPFSYYNSIIDFLLSHLINYSWGLNCLWDCLGGCAQLVRTPVLSYTNTSVPVSNLCIEGVLNAEA